MSNISMLANLCAIREGRYNSEQANFYLRELKRLTGINLQKLIVDCVISAVNYCPDYSQFKEVISENWDKENSKKGESENKK